MNDRTNPARFDLKLYYTVFLETGMILTLLSFIILTKISIHSSNELETSLSTAQEIVQIEEIMNTRQRESPPLPLPPAVPVEVPNSEIIEDDIILIDAELRIDDPLSLPPPPAPRNKNDDKREESFFVVVEEMPELIGGIASIQNEITYPEMARLARIEGMVIIQFIVNESGNVENPRVTRGIGGGCDEEALRVVQQASFKPGRQRGKPVRVQYSVPVIFKLRG